MGGVKAMKRLLLIAFCGFSLAGCQTSQKSAQQAAFEQEYARTMALWEVDKKKVDETSLSLSAAINAAQASGTCGIQQWTEVEKGLMTLNIIYLDWEALRLDHRASIGPLSVIRRPIDPGRLAQEERASYTIVAADSALKIGCIDIADEKYRSIVNEYTGSAFFNLRERAKIGIEDVRSRRKH